MTILSIFANYKSNSQYSSYGVTNKSSNATNFFEFIRSDDNKIDYNNTKILFVEKEGTFQSQDDYLKQLKDNHYLNESINRKMESCTNNPRDFESYIRPFGKYYPSDGARFDKDNIKGMAICEAFREYHKKNAKLELINKGEHRQETSEEIKFNTRLRNMIKESTDK